MNIEKLIDNVINFGQLHNRLTQLSSNDIKGDAFEMFAKLFFTFDHRYSNIVKNCWLLDELPTKIREKLNIPSKDIGIDLVIQITQNEYWAVQVKFRSDINTVIKWKELSTFYGLTFGLSQQFAKGIFFTNTLIPNKHITNRKNTINILYQFLDTTSKQTFQKINAYLNKKKIPKSLTYKPRPYQKIILEECRKHFKNNNKGRLYMPCGTGKTLVSYWIAMEQKHKMLICVAVPSLYLLSQVYDTWSSQLTKYKFLLVGSDAEVNSEPDTGLLLTTNKDEIRDFLEENESYPIIVITTYQSSEQFLNACKYEIDFCIFDEAHKTVGSKDRSFSCLLTSTDIRKRLFVTATERVYQGDNEKILSMDNKDIYGDMIYTYSLKSAIEDGHLTDYLIVAPLITDKAFWNMLKVNKLIIDKSIKKDPIQSRYYMTAYLLVRSIKERNLTHILTFNNTNANVNQFHKILDNMLKLCEIDCNCYCLTGNSSMKHRQKVVNDFKNDKVAVISSARIFSEGVDIPIVDCVCFVDNKLSVIDIIQSCGRALRLHPGKKLSYIILPTVFEFGNNDNLFKLSNQDFCTVKRVLKAMGTVDDRIVDQFLVSDNGNIYQNNKQFTTDSVDVLAYGEMEVNFDEFDKKIDMVICDRTGKDIDQLTDNIMDTMHSKIEKKCSFHLSDETLSDNEDTQTDLCEFGDENLSYLSNEDYKEILMEGHESIFSLFQRIFFDINHPENHNIHLNYEDEFIVYDGQDWKLDELGSFHEMIYATCLDILLEKIDELEDELPTMIRIVLPRTLHRISRNKELRICIGQKIRRICRNNRKMSSISIGNNFSA